MTNKNIFQWLSDIVLVLFLFSSHYHIHIGTSFNFSHNTLAAYALYNQQKIAKWTKNVVFISVSCVRRKKRNKERNKLLLLLSHREEKKDEKKNNLVEILRMEVIGC